MQVTQENMEALFTAFNAAYTEGLAMAKSQWDKVAMDVPSNTGTEEYDWLGDIPNVRKWLGDRVVHGLKEHGYRVKNEDFELTLGIPRNKIEDDAVGIYKPLFREMGRSISAFPDQTVFSLLKRGFEEECYDGQNFFDTDHPVINEAGETVSVANTDAEPGNAAPWFLLDTTRAIMPMTYQRRKDFEFIARDKLTDENVFWKKQFVYGSDGRANAGFGLWQLAWGSKKPLTVELYEAARQSMQELTGDYGRPLAIMPNILLHPPAYEKVAKQIAEAEQINGGDTNIWSGSIIPMNCPWLV